MLNKHFNSKNAEFITMYGRRRVGKTFLIRETFSQKDCYFVYATGERNAPMAKQLANFMEAVSATFYGSAPLAPATNWHDAFKLLHSQMVASDCKVVVFLDELPWMATPRSQLLNTIDYYWNRHWQQLGHVKLIVCGSSASWMIKKIIQDKGGLHGRTTCKIKLEPFTLAETREFLKSQKIRLNNKETTALYMALGGIPYYLRQVESGLTAAQNIQTLLFEKNAPLQEEFILLFQSLFNDADAYIELIRLIATKREGVSRRYIKEKVKLSASGGILTERLNDLALAGFIESYIPWGRQKGEYFKLVDEFCLFYLTWLDPQKNKRFLPDYWIAQSQKPAYLAWSGYAFEAICMKHLEQIIKALKIPAGGTASTWRYRSTEKEKVGAQIDLLIERSDNAFTIGEIKYTDTPFQLDKAAATQLQQKVTTFQQQTKTTKQLFIALISANGIKDTMYSEELVAQVVTLEDLFA
ncbi:MAG: hypothetical protein DHS20C10_02400 [marine bacterium B5-7]|nr:MAG: hypothetical protein DHS20C10_02400 [marine bacterium B5-7]